MVPTDFNSEIQHIRVCGQFRIKFQRLFKDISRAEYCNIQGFKFFKQIKYK